MPALLVFDCDVPPWKDREICSFPGEVRVSRAVGAWMAQRLPLPQAKGLKSP